MLEYRARAHAYYDPNSDLSIKLGRKHLGRGKTLKFDSWAVGMVVFRSSKTDQEYTFGNGVTGLSLARTSQRAQLEAEIFWFEPKLGG